MVQVDQTSMQTRHPCRRGTGSWTFPWWCAIRRVLGMCLVLMKYGHKMLKAHPTSSVVPVKCQRCRGCRSCIGLTLLRMRSILLQRLYATTRNVTSMTFEGFPVVDTGHIRSCTCKNPCSVLRCKLPDTSAACVA